MRPFFIHRFSLFIFLAVTVSAAHAQWFPSTLLSSPALSATDSNKLTLEADITGFFKNNEYFSPVAVGQTLPGISSTLMLGYQVAGKFKVELGARAVKYSGRDPLENLQAFVRLQYAITPNFNMVLGNLYGGVNHRLIEPLYQWERQYTANPESGLQFVLHTSRWFTDVWVDWEHFIQRGDSVPETLTFGASVSRVLTGEGSRFVLTVPLQLLIHHQGGQIDTSNDPMIVLGNLATGLCSRLNTGAGFVKSVGLDVYVAGYWDRYSNETLRPYNKGWGVYPVFHADASPFKFMAGYWNSDKFYAFEGEPLFGSFDPYNPQRQLPARSLLTCRLAFEKTLFKGISVGAQVETYSDLDRGETDYSFGVHLRFNNPFTLKQFK
ncbi:MAG: hypothetical protein LBL24_08015 [Bacteroidales bacterium]|jgi:hypothetical protein|nr:hypothetical protein [Bacteroidales bacterium]